MLARRTPGADSALTQGTLGDAMAYLRPGAGSPLMFMPGLSAHHRPPRGMDRWFQAQQIRPLARHHNVWWIPTRLPRANPGRPGQAHE
jgi:hypothetical protein